MAGIPNPIRVGILVVSDRRAAGAADLTWPQLVARVRALLPLAETTVRVVPDEADEIEAALRAWCAERTSLVLTTGGTGLGLRDVTPEATRAVLERPAPGLVHAMLAAGLTVTPHAMLGRPEAGTAGRTLIINLPGNPRGALEALAAIEPSLPHALAVLVDEPTAERGHDAGAAG